MNKNGYGVIAVRNDGYKFTYENGTWAVLEVDGMDFAETEVFKEPRGIGNGDIITGLRKHSREIKIKFALRNFKQVEYFKNRGSAIGFHDSNYTYDLSISYLGDTKIAKNCVILAASYPLEKFRTNAIMEVMFLSPSSELYANKKDNISFINRIPMWHCTRAYNGVAGTLTFGELVKATEKNINYTGTEKAPILATIRATGYIETITIGISNRCAEIKVELNKGDVLTINTEDRIVLKNGEPVSLEAYDAMDLVPLALKYGDNTVTINSNSTAYSAEVEYIGRYGGM